VLFKSSEEFGVTQELHSWGTVGHSSQGALLWLGGGGVIGAFMTFVSGADVDRGLDRGRNMQATGDGQRLAKLGRTLLAHKDPVST
jgi:hypothetical protein